MEASFIILFPDDPSDILHCTPLIRCLNTQVEDSAVHALINEEYRWILERNPHIGELFTYRENPREQLDPIFDLLPDYVIDLNGSRLMRRLKGRLKILDFPISWRERDGSFTERLFKTCRLFDVQDDGAGPELAVRKLDTALLPSEFLKGYFLLSLDAPAKGGRLLTDDQIIEFAVVTEKPIVVTGAVEHRHLANRISQSTGCAVFPTCGDLSPEEVASLAGSARGALVFDPFWEIAAQSLGTPYKLITRTPVMPDVKELALWARSQFKSRP